MDKRINDIAFRIGMDLHKICMTLPDNEFHKIKDYISEIEDKVIELTRIADNEYCRGLMDRQYLEKLGEKGEGDGD